MKLFKKMKLPLLCALSSLVASSCFAAMSSSNYKINADSINAGGDAGSSSSYNLNDTIGEIATGDGASATYKMRAGFQQMVNTYMTLAADNQTKDLGELIPGSPVTAETTMTVTTDAWNGYTLAVSKDHKMLNEDNVTTIDDHNGTISTPLTWESPNDLGFGFTVISGTDVEPKWGSSPDFAYAAFPDTSTTAHTKEGFKNDADDTVVGYKADVSSGQKIGAYSCTITYTAVESL